MSICSETRGECAREQRNRSEVQRQREPSSDLSQSRENGNFDTGRAFQLRKPVIDQVEADVRRSIVAPLAGRARARQLDRFCGYPRLGQPALLGDALSRVTVAVACRKLHRAINPARILAQYGFYHAHRLDELAPIDRAEKAETADTVADRNLVCSLLLVFRLHQLFDRQMRFRELLFDPCQRQGQRRTLPLQTARKLRDERASHRRRRSRHVGNHEDQVFGSLFGNLHHLIGPGIGQVALGSAGRQSHPDAAEILDQGEPQHDRDGP